MNLKDKRRAWAKNQRSEHEGRALLARGEILDEFDGWFSGWEDDNKIFNRAIYRDIINSESFRRLRQISFLGAIDYTFRSDRRIGLKRQNRYDHSLVVAKLALLYARLLGLSASDEQYLVLSSLLHDIGHAPMSHSLEPLFERLFAIDHHRAAQRLIYGLVSYGSEMRDVLSFHRIDRDRLIETMAGKASERGAQILSGPLNIDTMDGVFRSYCYVSRVPPVARPHQVLRAYMNRSARDLSVLDGFWQAKAKIYRYLIYSYSGRLADAGAQFYFEKVLKNSKGDLWYWGESAFRRRFSEFFSFLAHLTSGRTPEIWSLSRALIENRRVREFYIDRSVCLREPNEDFKRYKIRAGAPTSLRVSDQFWDEVQCVGETSCERSRSRPEPSSDLLQYEGIFG